MLQETIYQSNKLFEFQFTRIRPEGETWPHQWAAMLMAILGLGVSSFSVAQMSAVSTSKTRRHFPKAPWN